MLKEKILIVDDEKPINDLIRSYVEKEGYQTVTAFTGVEGLEKARQENPDLIILDVMLPDMEGTSVCLEMRKATQAPILFLSCKSQEIDKIIALSVGGDDYITKPFMGGELVARIKAHLRRQKAMESRDLGPAPGRVYDFPGLWIDTNTREILADGKKVSLTSKEFEILMLLIENPKRVFSAEQIFELTWKTECLGGDSRTVMVYISNLRKKLEINPQNPRYILSIRGVGYKFNHKIIEE